MEYLGLNIRKIRERWDLSQEEFGHLIGATRGMIMQYENRGTKPKNETVSQLVKLTGLSLDMLANSPLKDDELPGLDQASWLAVCNYREREDPDQPPLTEEEIKELMKIRRKGFPGTSIPRNDGSASSSVENTDELVAFLKSNDAFFKNQYSTFNAQVLANLTALQHQAKYLEALVKINLEHTGNIEAHQLGVKAEKIHERINKDILDAAGVRMDIPADSGGTS